MGGRVEFGVLGPLEVRIGEGQPVALGGIRQRALLVLLALRAGEVVSTDRLVDELWGEQPPAQSVHTIHVFVSRLRKALAGAEDRLLTRLPGYALILEAGELDADRCRRLYGEARIALAAARPDRAVELLHEALGMWRGPPLAEFTYEPFAQAAIAQLEELRESCRDELVDAELACGRHAELISELESRVREQPFRERLHGQLMLALYRCGRQAEALEAYQRARHTLMEELGVEPSATLVELEQAILRQDQELDPVPDRLGMAAPEAPAVGPSAEEAPEPTVEPDGGQAHALPEPVTAPGVVRKIATVLVIRFVSPVGVDPEIGRSLIGAARRTAEEAVRRHGGVPTPGGHAELIGLFGLPLIRDDDAVRALRAAEEAVGNPSVVTGSEGHGVMVRIGLDTGEIVAAEPGDVFGGPLDRAAALALTARDREILLSDATRHLAGDAIEVESSAQPGSWMLREVPAAPRPLPMGDFDNPMVNREAELETAIAAFDQTLTDDGVHLLTVIGDPGIGKSRLSRAIVERVGDRATVLTGHCLAYGRAGLWPLREAIVAAGGYESAEAISRLLGETEDAERTTRIVAAALGLSPGEADGDEQRWAFRRLFERLARRRAVMLVIEDAHWAQPPLLELIDYLFDWVAAPLFVLCLARPELLETRPQWGGGHQRISSMVLAPLSDAEAHAILSHQLGPEALTSSESARILQAAEGNPLFVEQLRAMHAENPGWDLEREIPAKIQTLLAARLDQLGPGERELIQRGAVIGREFWPDAVSELLPPEARPSAERHLHALVRRGFVQPTRSGRAAGEQVRFHHILIRDVAYRSTPKALRRELHERLADWLERRGEQYTDFVGHHLERAYGYAVELQEPDARLRGLAARTGAALWRAGRAALARGDTNASVQALRRAAELMGAGGEPRPEVLLDLGSGLSDSGDFATAEKVLEDALAQAQAVGADGLAARAQLELSYWRSRVDPSTRTQEMLRTAELAINVFERTDDSAGLSRAWLHVAWVHWINLQSAQMEPALEQALGFAERAGERQGRSRMLSDLARAAVVGPRPVADALDRCRQIVERTHGDVAPAAFTEAMMAVLEAMDGRPGSARARWWASRRRLEEYGLSHAVGVVQMYYAFVELLSGDPAAALPEVTEACALFETIGEGGRLSTCSALQARLYEQLERFGEAEQASLTSEHAASPDDVVSQVLWRCVRARLLARMGDRTRAEALASQGVEFASGTDFLMLHADALRDRADVLAVLDRPQPAIQDLQAALRLYERKGIRPGVEGVKRRLESLAASAPVGPIG